MKRKLILKTIACLLMLGGCTALTTCTKQKPNVLKTQQVRRANENRINAVNINIKYTVDIDLTYYTTFYFIRNTTNETADIYFTDDVNNTYQNNITLTKDYEIMVIYNTAYNGINQYYYDLYYYDIFDSVMNTISQQTELLNIQDSNINLIEVNGVNAYIGGYLEDSGEVNNAFDGWADEGYISSFYRSNYLNYIQPHLLGDAQATINQLLIDYRDAMRENQALQTIIESREEEITSLNERIDNLTQIYEEETARQQAIIDNLRELNNLPTHLGGWFELVINLLQNLWNMELLPHIKLGYFVALPILFTLVSLIIKLVRGA